MVKSRSFLVFLVALVTVIACGCSSLRPQVSLPADEQSPVYIPPTVNPAYAGTSTPDESTLLNAQVPGCSSKLTVLNDITIPDGTYVSPGTSLDKQWQVENSGTCNWNETYTVRLIDGSSLGTEETQSITPLRAGVEGTLRIQFVAPDQPGNYRSTWQAYDTDGKAFGDEFWIEINVLSE